MNPDVNTTICQICGEQLTDQKHFYRKHEITMSEYYQQYFPRHDLLTEELIEFKDLSHYQTVDFLNKNNLKKWLINTPVITVQKYLTNILKTRQQKKNLVYIPTQTELRSLPNFPSIITFNKIFGDYYKWAEDLGLKTRGFIQPPEKFPSISTDPFGDTPVVLCDTREQRLLKLQLEFEVATLNYGDYCLKNNKNKVFIERKSLTDAISSFTIGRNRLERELERANNDGAYVVVVIENSLANALSFNHLPWINKQTKITPDFLFHNIREIIQKFVNCQFLFTKNRVESVQWVEKILLSTDLAKIYDLQLIYDQKIL